MIYGTGSKTAAHAYSTSITPHRHSCTIITKQSFFIERLIQVIPNKNQKVDTYFRKH